MVVYGEKLWGRSVSVFRWNEKLGKAVVQEGEGVFVFHVVDSLLTYVPWGGYLDSSNTCKQEPKKRVIPFQLRRLLGGDESIERLTRDAIEATRLCGGLGLGVPSGSQRLEAEVWKTLKSHFSSEDHRKGLLLIGGPVTVIFVKVCRQETCDYSKEDFGPYPTRGMMREPTHFARQILEEEEEGDGEIEDDVIAEVNREECLVRGVDSRLGYELMKTLRSSWWWGRVRRNLGKFRYPVEAAWELGREGGTL